MKNPIIIFFLNICTRTLVGVNSNSFQEAPLIITKCSHSGAEFPTPLPYTPCLELIVHCLVYGDIFVSTTDPPEIYGQMTIFASRGVRTHNFRTHTIFYYKQGPQTLCVFWVNRAQMILANSAIVTKSCFFFVFIYMSIHKI